MREVVGCSSKGTGVVPELGAPFLARGPMPALVDRDAHSGQRGLQLLRGSR